MKEEPILGTAVGRRNHIGLSLGDKAYVANKAFVENRVNLLPIVNSPIRMPDNSCTGRGSEGFHCTGGVEPRILCRFLDFSALDAGCAHADALGSARNHCTNIL